MAQDEPFDRLRTSPSKHQEGTTDMPAKKKLTQKEKDLLRLNTQYKYIEERQSRIDSLVDL